MKARIVTTFMSILIALAAAFGLYGPTVALAAECTWTGLGVDASWSDPLNWSGCGGNYPEMANGNTAYVPAAPARQPRVNASMTLDGVRIDAGAALTVSADVTLTLRGLSAISGTLAVTQKGVLQLAANSPAGAQAVFVVPPAVAGDLELTSTGGAYTPTLSVANGPLTIGATGRLRVTAGAGGGRVIQGSLANYGTVELTSGHLEIDLDKLSGAIGHLNAGRMVVAGDVTGNAEVLTNTGSLEFRDPATMPAAPSGLAHPQGGLNGLLFGACAVVRNGAGGAIKVGAGVVTTTISAALENAGAMTVTSPLVLDKASGAQVNSGQMVVSADVSGNGAVFTNTGSLEFRDPATLPAAPSSIAQPQAGKGGLAFSACAVVRNGLGGSIKVGASALTTTLSAQLENGGVMTVTSPLVLDKAGGAQVNSGQMVVSADVSGNGAVFTNTGSLEFRDPATLSAAPSGLFQPSGMSSFAFSACGLVRNGAGGSIKVGAGVVTTTISAALENAGVMTVTSPLVLDKAGGAHVNSGRMVVSADVSGNGAVFTNTGSLEFHDPATLPVAPSGLLQPQAGVSGLLFGACGLVRNGAGGAIKVGAGVVTTTIGAALENSGAMTVTSPLVLDKAGGAQVNSGRMVVTADVSGNGAVFTNTGSLEFAAPGTVLAPNGPAQPQGGLSGFAFSACGLVRNGAGGAIKVGAGVVTTTLSAQLENGGVMTVTSPLVLDKAGGSHVNSGRMVVTADVSGNGAVFTNTGSLEFRDPATVPNAPSSVNAPAGTLGFAFGACALVRNGAGGTIKVGAGVVTTTLSAALENGGVMTVTSPLVLDKAGGALSNDGRIALAGGNVDLVGDYTQSAPGALYVAIGGTTPRTQYYVLNVSGAAALAGGLNLTLINGFVPANGDTFTFLNAGTRSGTFSTITGTAAPGGKLLAATYGATYARIITLGQSLFLPLIRR